MTLEVLEVGWATSIQDRGRPGWAYLGVGRSGAMDQRAAALANRLVGNPPEAAVIETAGGVRLRSERHCVVAVTGARSPVTIDGRPQGWDAPLIVGAQTALAVDVALPGQGRWSYIAVQGGVAVPPVLGSRSWDTLGHLGPGPLAAGSQLPIGAVPAGPLCVDLAPVAPWIPGDLVIRVWPGPRLDRCQPDTWKRLTSQRWVVDDRSDRVGTVLQGAPLQRLDTDDLPSEAMVTGAVQLPRGGQPIVMMRDHPTTGGYPVIAVVDPDGLDALAQRQPGDGVRMVPVNSGRRTL